MYVCTCIFMCIFMSINLFIYLSIYDQSVSLGTHQQLRSMKILKDQSAQTTTGVRHSISLVATLLNQQSAQLKKVKEHCLRSICEQQLYCSLRAHQSNSGQMKSLKYQSDQTTIRAVGIAYFLWPPFPINRALNFAKLRSII